LIKKHSDERWQTHSNLLEALRDKDSRYLKQGSLALSVSKVAEGVFDGVIEYGWRWDFSAAKLILSEAGGSYRYRPESSDGLDEFVGSNSLLQNELVELLDDARR
jgi:fructose-1,6-bisphosphatase/inositol monophosphatase family enzyme